jgi:GDP-4-dehydro-6-deoxy-D-mannose reductase
MRIFVSGGDGFIGAHLVRALQLRGHEVSAPVFEIRSRDEVDRALSAEPWDRVIHLAAISHALGCDRDPEKARAINCGGTEILVECSLRRSPQARLIFASTAQVYADSGNVSAVTMDEGFRIAPQNFYAQTKLEAEQIILQAAEAKGLKAAILRLFNHSHRTQATNFFLPYLYSTLNANKGGSVVVSVGNLDLSRDIGALPDLLTAWVQVVEAPEGKVDGVFNVCSGRAKRLRTLAEKLAAALDVKAEFVPDPSRMRPGEPKLIQGDHSKLSRAIGWSPTMTSEDELIRSFLS